MDWWPKTITQNTWKSCCWLKFEIPFCFRHVSVFWSIWFIGTKSKTDKLILGHKRYCVSIELCYKIKLKHYKGSVEYLKSCFFAFNHINTLLNNYTFFFFFIYTGHTTSNTYILNRKPPGALMLLPSFPALTAL